MAISLLRLWIIVFYSCRSIYFVHDWSFSFSLMAVFFIDLLQIHILSWNNSMFITFYGELVHILYCLVFFFESISANVHGWSFAHDISQWSVIFFCWAFWLIDNNALCPSYLAAYCFYPSFLFSSSVYLHINNFTINISIASIILISKKEKKYIHFHNKRRLHRMW